jgi:hypothetical protein
VRAFTLRIAFFGALVAGFLVAGAFAQSVGASARDAGSSARVPAKILRCKSGYRKVTLHKIEVVQGKRKRVAYFRCERLDLSTFTSVSQVTSSPTVVVTVTTVASNGKTPPHSHYSVSIIDKASGATLGKWTASPLTNAAGPSMATIEWTFAKDSSGDTVLTLSTAPIQGIAWKGPVTVTAPAADVAGLDIAVKASFLAEHGFQASSSVPHTLPI